VDDHHHRGSHHDLLLFSGISSGYFPRSPMTAIFSATPLVPLPNDRVFAHGWRPEKSHIALRLARVALVLGCMVYFKQLPGISTSVYSASPSAYLTSTLHMIAPLSRSHLVISFYDGVPERPCSARRFHLAPIQHYCSGLVNGPHQVKNGDPKSDL
jgi:hypothetical protein